MRQNIKNLQTAFWAVSNHNFTNSPQASLCCRGDTADRIGTELLNRTYGVVLKVRGSQFIVVTMQRYEEGVILSKAWHNGSIGPNGAVAYACLDSGHSLRQAGKVSILGPVTWHLWTPPRVRQNIYYLPKASYLTGHTHDRS